MGLGDLGATLAAYSHTSAGYARWVTNSITNGYFRVALIPTDTSLPIAYNVHPVPILHPHFPYGLAVTPDGPL
jgi:hypothetical protein